MISQRAALRNNPHHRLASLPMPIYLYEYLDSDANPREQVELMQKMSDPPLAVHPDNGRPIQRIVARPSVKGLVDSRGDAMLKDSNLEKMGFTKYVRSEKGTYEKTAGRQGPDLLRP
jgi:predicted nucleic acid-binding Zn ribbon protein